MKDNMELTPEHLLEIRAKHSTGWYEREIEEQLRKLNNNQKNLPHVNTSAKKFNL